MLGVATRPASHGARRMGSPARKEQPFVFLLGTYPPAQRSVQTLRPPEAGMALAER